MGSLRPQPSPSSRGYQQIAQVHQASAPEALGPPGRSRQGGELRTLASEGVIGPGSGLAVWLEAMAMEPADFYGVRGAGFTSLRRELG